MVHVYLPLKFDWIWFGACGKVEKKLAVYDGNSSNTVVDDSSSMQEVTQCVIMLKTKQHVDFPDML